MGEGSSGHLAVLSCSSSSSSSSLQQLAMVQQVQRPVSAAGKAQTALLRGPTSTGLQALVQQQQLGICL
jgi:hypothetical protein